MMYNTERKRLNALFLLCRAEGITLSALSRATGIDRTRLHRLAHKSPQSLRESLTIAEALKITGAFPNHNFSF